MHTHTHTHAHTRSHTHIKAWYVPCLVVCIWEVCIAHTHTQTHTYTHSLSLSLSLSLAHSHSLSHTHTHTQTHTNTHIHTHTHTHTHIHTHSEREKERDLLLAHIYWREWERGGAVNFRRGWRRWQLLLLVGIIWLISDMWVCETTLVPCGERGGVGDLSGHLMVFDG